jgi:hypothetical protein
MTDFSFDDFLETQEVEKSETNAQSDGGFSFDDFLNGAKSDSPSEIKDNPLPAEEESSDVPTFGEYDTKLNPEEERQYQKWRQTLPKNLQYEGDYDLRGYWKDPETAKEAVGGDHFIDKYKKPNHPTFSNESQYAVGENAKKAGRWEGERYIPASQKRVITMSADEMNVPQSTILSKDEAKEMGEMNANEVAARSYEQATGVDAPDNKIFAHIANMGSNVGGRLNANLQMQAAQQLLSKSGNRSDDETRGLFSKMILGATKYLGGRLFVDDALDEWDETEGKSYKTPEERTRARNEFVDELARQFIAERTATKHNATMELENRDQGFWATVLGEGPAQVANSLPYMLGPVGIALQFAQQSAATGTGYANDEYGFAKDGSLGVVAEGDSAGKAAVKGVASGAFEAGSEIVGGKIAGAVGKRLGKVLSKGGKVLVGKYPVIAEKAGIMAETKVGTAVSKFGTGMKNLFAWTSKKLHLENPIEENIEEWETENLNALFGTGARDSEYVNNDTGSPLDTWDRLKKANSEFFKPDNFIKMNEAMLLMMGGGAFISHMAQRGMEKEVDSFLREHKLMTDKEIASTDLQTKAQALDAWSKNLSEEEVLKKIDSATSLVDKLADKIAAEPSQAQKTVTLKRHLSEMNDFNSLIERAGEIDKATREQGGTTKRFTVQQDENGNPKFDTTIGVDPVTDDNVEIKEMFDADSGVTVKDANGTYVVKSDVTGEKFKTSNFNRAINAADAMAVLNQQRVAERQTKIQVLENLSQNEAYANRKIEVFETADQARQAIGGDFENDAPGFTTDDGTTVLILDNLDNPATALAALDKGTESDRGAFPDGVNFETVAEKDDDGEVVETRVARDKVHNVTIIENPDGKGFTVFGKDVPYTNVATIEEATALARGEKIETPKEEVINETRTDETPAQPEQAQPVTPSAGEEARPMEAGEAPSEVGGEVDGDPNADYPVGTIIERSDGSRYIREEGNVTTAFGESVPKWREFGETGAARNGGKGRTAEQSHVFDGGGKVITYPTPTPAVEAPTSVPTEVQANTPPKATERAKGGSDAADAVQNIADKKTARVDEKATENADSTPQTPEKSTDVEKNSKNAETSKTEPAPFEVGEAKSIKKRLEKKRNKGGALTEEETALLGRAEEAIKADVKAKRDASRAATLEKAEAVQPPSWMGKNAGPAETRMADLSSYLADKGHNRASLHRAIQSVRDYAKKHGALALSKNDKATLADALAKATERLAKMKENDQAAFAERNADMPTSQLEEYLVGKPNKLLSYWLEHGALLSRPRSAAAAKKAAGGKGVLRDAKFDGKLFDPDSVGADELNHFFDGMNERERNKWLKLLFGKDTKEVSDQTVTGNDVTLEDLGLSMGDALDAFREAYGDFQEWRANGAESGEEAYYRNQYEEEQAALDEEFGPVAEYALDELAAREAADKEYANAMAYVENKATAKDIAVLKPSNLSAAAEGDKIRVDHHKKTFDFLGYDTENGILYLEDRVEVETDEGSYLAPETRYYRVSEDAISEITKEQANGFRNETGASDNRASDEKGASRGGSREEGQGGSQTEVEGRVREETERGNSREVSAGRTGESGARTDNRPAGTAGNVNQRSSQYKTIAKAVDLAWQAEHPDEVAELLKEGIDASAVASNPNVKGTDEVSWPVTATRVGNREDAANIFRIVSNPDVEITKVLYLDEDGNILDRRITNVGIIGETDINAENLISNIPEGTYGIILSHNHPAQQGDDVHPTIGYDDVATNWLKNLVESVGVKLLDHIITDHNAYYSFGGTSLVSEGVNEFWSKAQALSDFFGESVEKPADVMNLVSYDERIDLTKDVIGRLNALAALASKTHDKSSWVVAVDDNGKVAWIAAAPKNANTAALRNFIAQHHGGRRYVVLNGENAVDMLSFVKALKGNEHVFAIGENGKLVDFGKDGSSLNDKILNAAKPAASSTFEAASVEEELNLLNIVNFDPTQESHVKDLIRSLPNALTRFSKDYAEYDSKLRKFVERFNEQLKKFGYLAEVPKLKALLNMDTYYSPDDFGQRVEMVSMPALFKINDSGKKLLQKGTVRTSPDAQSSYSGNSEAGEIYFLQELVTNDAKTMALDAWLKKWNPIKERIRVNEDRYNYDREKSMAPLSYSALLGSVEKSAILKKYGISDVQNSSVESPSKEKVDQMSTPTPRLANVPKLDDETTKEIADILGDIGGLLDVDNKKSDGEMLFSPVAPLDAVKWSNEQLIPQSTGKMAKPKQILAKMRKRMEKNRGYSLSYDEVQKIISIGNGMSLGQAMEILTRQAMTDLPIGSYSFIEVAKRIEEMYGFKPFIEDISKSAISLSDRFGGRYYAATNLGLNEFAVRDTLQRFSPNNNSILRSSVEPLSLTDAEEDEFFRSVRRMAKALKAKGYDTFEDMIRTVASMRPDIYERGKDLFRRAWNFYDVETDGITIARGKEIFGKIDAELKETTNDNRRSEPQTATDGGTQSDRGGDVGRGTGSAVAPRVGDSHLGPRDGNVGTVAGHQSTDEYERGGDGSDGSQSGEAVLGGGYAGDGGESDRLRTDERRSDVRADAEQSVPVGSIQSVEATEEVTPGFMEYQPPADLPVAAPKSQSLIVESSALASVTPPKIETKPNIPDEIPSKGILQAHQYQAVCQAVNAQNKLLPDGRRMGYFCGDGTGVGKTRTIAGVLLDAMNRKLGKSKALIVSKNSDLFDSAKSDFEPFGLANNLFKLDDKGRKHLVFGTGIAFTTYDGLAENYAGTDAEGNICSAGKKGKTTSRYAELVRWLGKDFDGVIAFDEAHSAAKDDGSGASPKGQVKRAQAVIDLQAALPNARILYLTATSAYNAEDLRFLQRMGLWGEGTGFRTLEEFSEAINKGGLSMMEMLTQGMKARGQYCSRSISFKGVTCRREVAVMTPEQKEVYDNYRSVITAIHNKLAELSSYTGDKPAQLTKMYFGRALDLFNSVITAMKVKKAIEIGRQAIADGKSPVFQLISTNEAAKNAKNGGKKKRTEIDFFSTPQEVAEQEEQEVGVKDRVISYLKGNGFPIREWLEETDSQGKHLRGEIIPEAEALRDEMIALAETLPDVGNPIDEIVKAFQDVGISRISSGSNKNAEADAFNSGKNLALVFSGAGGTGASYHADKRFKNQRQRVQIPIEFGWEPDKFIQALGRSHRNNQVVPPEFVLLTTDIAGEMRFMSTIANRVASMGAIVGGDRNSSGQVVSAADSMDNTYGRTAIKNVARNLASGQVIGDVSGIEALHSMFLNPDKIDKLEANKFLGRLQFLSVDDQNEIYSAIASATEKAIAAAKADGSYDDGIRKIDANRTVVKSRQTLSKGDSDTETRELLTTSEWYDSRRITHEELEERAPQGQSVEYVRNKRSGKLYGIFQNGNRIARLAPDGSYTALQPLERGNYEIVINKDAARKEWDDEYSKLPAEVEKINHYMAGDLIPVWDKIGIQGRPFVYRGTPVGSKPFIGVHITDAQLPVTLYGFGKKEEARKFFNDNAYRLASREGMKIGLTAARHENDQPYFKRAKIGTRYVLTAFKVPNGSSMAGDFIDSGWDSTWAKDENNPFDRGGTVYYREFGEDAEAAFNEIVNKYGVVIYHGDEAVFESRDGMMPAPIERIPISRATTPSRSMATSSRNDGSLGARLGMPNMRMRVERGELIITNTDARFKNDLKLAFGGEWANRVRDGKRYVKSDLRWNKPPFGRGGWWSIPLNKVPANILAEVENDGMLHAPVAPLSSVEEMDRDGGVARLAQNPEEFKTTFVYNLLRAEVKPLGDSNNKVISEKELLRRAIDDGDMTAIGELYNRYMAPNAAKGGLKGLIRRAAARKGMERVMNENRVEEVASLVWAGSSIDGGYELNRRGIIADINAGDTEIYKKTGSLIPVMTEKVDRILNDMAERAKNRPEMQTLDAPSMSREGESELDQQIADDAGVVEGLYGADTINEFVESADYDTIIADKLRDAGEVAGRRLTASERNRLNAMDMLDELMYFLPEEYQDVLNAVLAAERERGLTSNNSHRDAQGRKVAAASIEKAQAASGLSKRVFNARLVEARKLMNEIWKNIRNGKSDDNITIKIGEFVGAEETDEELNESILEGMSENASTSDMALATRLLLRGESVEDVAYFFDISPAMVRAWKARARNEHLIVFPGDEAENTLGFENFPERKAVKRGTRSGGTRKARSTTWTPDLFPSADATVNDITEEKIAEGIAAGATDEEIARNADTSPEIVKLHRIREKSLSEEPIDAAKVRRGEQSMFFDDLPSKEKTKKDTTSVDYFVDIRNKPKGGFLFAPVAPLEQETLGIELPPIEGAMGFTNAEMNKWRSEHGFTELAKRAKMSLDDLHRQGAAMANNTDEMRKMIERHERAPYALSAIDQVALGQFIVKSQNAYNDLAVKKREAYENGNEALAIQYDMEMDDTFSWLDRAQRVNQRVGTEWGRAGRIRQITIDKAGNLADYMVSCARAKGSPLTKSEKAEAELIYRKFEEAREKHENLKLEDVISQLDALSKVRLARQQDGIKERKGKYTPENIERDYVEALAQIRYHGEHRSGGVLHGLPNGQKWIRAIEAYHLMNGEGLTDGKPDGAKMAQLVLDDVLAQGVTASLWDIRQMESRMGNLIKPSQDEISKSLRDIHSQMLIEQQMEHILATGEMPPKTGFDRDEESAAVRQLRRERDRIVREKGIDRRTYEERLKTALDSYKTRLRNQIEENEKAIADIEAGRPYTPRTNRKLTLDEEAQALKERNKELKDRIKELTDDPAKNQEKRIERALAAVGRHIAIRKEQIAAINAGTFDFDKKPEKLESPELTAARDELKKLNEDFKSLKKALYPNGTDAEIAHRLKLREAALEKQYERWNKMAADYNAADTWEARWAAVAPSAKKPPLESEATRNMAKDRDAAHRKVLEFRKKLELEDTRGEAAKAWARFIGGTSVLARAMLDMSVIGVQGGKFLRSHPIKGVKIGWKATKAFFKKNASDALTTEIANHPYFEDFKNNGGHIYAMDGLEGDTPEDFRVLEQGAPLPKGKMLTADMIPGVKRSSRSFAGFLNKAALELYSDMVEAAGANGTGATAEQKKLIADFVNISLGYGYGKKNVGKKLAFIPAVLDAIAWAPRKAVAELKHATLYPLATNWMGTRKHEISGREIWSVDKAIGREYLRYTLGSLAFGACMVLLAKLFNGDDDDDRNVWSDILDSRSSDFGRVRIGNTSYSVFAGNEMVWRLFARLYAGQTKTNGVVKETNRGDVVLNYLRGKINPIGGTVWDVSTGKNMLGEKLSEKSAWELANDYALPLTASAIYENFAKNPDDPLAAIFNAAPTFFGMTSYTYERDPLARVVKQGDEAVRIAKSSGDKVTAERIGASLKGARTEVYGAAKEVLKLEKKLKELKTMKSESADVKNAIKELEKVIPEKRKAAMELYRRTRNSGIKWDNMGWTK